MGQLYHHDQQLVVARRDTVCHPQVLIYCEVEIF